MKTKRPTVEEAIQEATEKSVCFLGAHTSLCSRNKMESYDTLLQEKEGVDPFPFSDAPFWIASRRGFVIPVQSPDFYALKHVLDNLEEFEKDRN